MKDAIGGTFAITAIIIALIIIMCLMAFAVNYSKAFRVKDEIRSIIEKNDGLTESAEEQINEMARKYQYFLNEDIYRKACEKLGYDTYTGGSNSSGSGVFFCIKCNYANNIEKAEKDSMYKGAYYSIVTFVNIDVPLINNVIPFAADFLKVSGETALIYSKNNDNTYCSGR